MFADLPPPADAPGISAAQQSDLECLSIGSVLAHSAHAGMPSSSASRLVRIYLSRLRSSDGSREWLRMIVPESEMTYGWFLSRLRECQRPLRPAPFRGAPSQAAPPPAPAQPTGG